MFPGQRMQNVFQFGVCEYSQKSLDRDSKSLEQHLLLANTKQDAELARVSKWGFLIVS